MVLFSGVLCGAATEVMCGLRIKTHLRYLEKKVWHGFHKSAVFVCG